MASVLRRVSLKASLVRLLVPGPVDDCWRWGWDEQAVVEDFFAFGGVVADHRRRNDDAFRKITVRLFRKDSKSKVKDVDLVPLNNLTSIVLKHKINLFSSISLY